MTTEYLIELIKNNTRVIIPEFGAFLIKDDGSGVFKPENLTFSPFLRYNDGMLEDNLASAKKITKDKAKELLANYTESLKQELTEKGTYELHEIGKLYLDKRGSIHFDAITATGNAAETPKPAPKAAEPKKAEPKPVSKQEEVKKEVASPIAHEKETKIAQTPEKKVEEKTVETPTKTEPKPVTPKQEPQKEKKIEAVKLTPTPTKPKVTKEKSSGGTGKAGAVGQPASPAVRASGCRISTPAAGQGPAGSAAAGSGGGCASGWPRCRCSRGRARRPVCPPARCRADGSCPRLS